VSEITIFLLYQFAATAFALSRLPRFGNHGHTLTIAACVLVALGVFLHTNSLYSTVLTPSGFDLSLQNAASMIGLELALIGLIAGIRPGLRGIAAGLLVLGAIAALMTGIGDGATTTVVLSRQVQIHVLISLMSYGLLTVGAIVALYAFLQERRLRAGQLSSINRFFAPLETTEQLLFGIAGAGFAGLLLAILSGMTFVENLFAQHLVHKTVFSLLSLLVFGTLLAGRFMAGWRGMRAIKLYLGGFLLLCLAYFGTRIVLEQLLGHSWG
jgi:ABC-type uncharacterized transport system permease subunit